MTTGLRARGALQVGVRSRAGVERVVDAAAITRNTRRVSRTCRRRVLAVVTEDGYGHGAVTVARAALAGGAVGLGVASLDEAGALRAAGITAPVLCWSEREPDPAAAVGLDCVLAVATAAELERGGHVRVEGVMSHLDRIDAPGSPEVASAVTAFHRAVATARVHGLAPRTLHLGGTSAALPEPRARLSQVRVGAALVGIAPAGALRLTAAMSLTAPVLEVRELAAGAAVDDGVRVLEAGTHVALVPLGHGDGLTRPASGASVGVRGELRPVLGTTSTGALVVDLGPASGVDAGDRVVLLGDAARGEPTAAHWAAAAGTSPHEVLAAVGRCWQTPRTTT